MSWDDLTREALGLAGLAARMRPFEAELDDDHLRYRGWNPLRLVADRLANGQRDREAEKALSALNKEWDGAARRVAVLAETQGHILAARAPEGLSAPWLAAVEAYRADVLVSEEGWALAEAARETIDAAIRLRSGKAVSRIVKSPRSESEMHLRELAVARGRQKVADRIATLERATGRPLPVAPLPSLETALAEADAVENLQARAATWVLGGESAVMDLGRLEAVAAAAEDMAAEAADRIADSFPAVFSRLAELAIYDGRQAEQAETVQRLVLEALEEPCEEPETELEAAGPRF